MTGAPQIFEALAAVMADCDHVAKRDRNDHQGFMFRGIDAVVNAVGPILRKHSVIVTPDIESVAYMPVTTTNNKSATACRVVVAYTFHAGDGSSLTVKVAGEAWDHGDKATPKAMSVAFRTALLQALALPTDEPDPDTHTFEQVRAEGPRDWESVADNAEALTDPDEVRALWRREGIGTDTPKVIKDRITAHLETLVTAAGEQSGE
jgi:hypothetical protein